MHRRRVPAALRGADAPRRVPPPAAERAGSLAFLASGAYPWERLITHRIELDALRLLADPPRDLLKAAVLPVTREQVLAFRLARHRLDRRAPAGKMLAVARDLCGSHAQLASSAELALWARVEDVSREDVRSALEEERTLVKTWAMRGTLHLVPADDLDLYVAALGPRWDSVTPGWLRGFGLTPRSSRRSSRTCRAPSTPGRGRASSSPIGSRTPRRPRNGEHLRSGWGALLKPSAHRGDLASERAAAAT